MANLGHRCAFGAKQIRSCFGSKGIGIAIALRRLGPRRNALKVVRPKSHWRKRPRAAQCASLGTVSRKPKGESVGLRGCE